ncbi:MAG: creatininase family protein [Vicinamibacterales bacterium]|nr:creatininase family protein [Vicinamibacterales bacterium]
MMALHPVRLAGVILIIALGGPAVAAGQSSGWRSLFDGTTLTGWTSVGEARWTVVDRAMAANPSAQTRPASEGKPSDTPISGFLRSTETFDDFELTAEFWADPNANSGLFIRCGQPSATGGLGTCYEINISDNHAVSPTGSIVGVHSTLPARVKSMGKWSLFEVRAQGNHLVVKVNGETTVDAHDDKFTNGALGLQAGGPNGPGLIKFRNIRVRPLLAPGAPTSVSEKPKGSPGPRSLLIEEMTWTEVRDAIAAGKTTAIYYTGAIEQNGPGVALGKHLFIAHYLAQRIAEQLGNALVYPTMPFAPTGDWGLVEPGVIDQAKRTSHMRMAGNVNVSEETFGAVAHDVAMSAIAAGFKNVVFIDDHGGGQQTLAKVAKQMNSDFGPRGVHVFHIPDLYYKEKDFMRDYLPKHNLPLDNHSGTDDTSEVLFVDRMAHGDDPRWIRPDKLSNTGPNDPSGVNGDQTLATLEMGKIFTDVKINLAVAQIKQLIADAK